jgi:two-component system, OmpR family, sensor histidine kinase TctE
MASLRLRLLAWLLPPLLFVGLVAAWGADAFMQRRLTEAYDLDLGDIARAIAAYVRAPGGKISLELTPLADAVLRADSTDQISYAVLDAGGGLVAGDPALPAPPHAPSTDPHFWNAMRDGVAVRAVVLDTLADGTLVRIVATETTRKRSRATRDAAVSASIPAVLLVIAAMAGMVVGVGRGLRPLDALGEQLQTRSHVDLRPVGESDLVTELRPLVQALNGMLARLDEAQHTQTRFIANAAHQLRTPIAGVINQLDLAKGGGSERETHVAHAREGASRLARLAHQILSLAKADPRGNPDIPRERIDLAEIVKSRAGEWVRMVTARNVELEFDLAPAPSTGDALLVGELAANLVDNAARYGARNVTVSTRADGHRSVIEVADDGHGIPPGERTRIFERFRRLDNESTEGSGLGLAIVSEIAQRHGATVDVRDGPGGRGTSVVVSFPAESAHE